MEVLGLQLEATSGVPLVLLRESADPHRVLPIFIGQPEAVAIALGIEGVEPPRPQTHDLLVDLLANIETSLEEVVVTEVRDGTFYAELHLSGPEGKRTISSRPSDAIALAVRLHTPVFAEEAVLEESGVQVSSGDELIEDEVEEFRQFLEGIDPEDFTGGTAPGEPPGD